MRQPTYCPIHFRISVCIAFTWMALLPAAFAFAGPPLKVYILAGQSNMQGHARTSTLDYIGDDPSTRHLLDLIQEQDGTPKVSKSVWISYLTGSGDSSSSVHGQLTTGYGARRNPAQSDDKIGPELTFGLTMEQRTQDPILIIKTAWGGKSLFYDFRPPSAGAYAQSERDIERNRNLPANAGHYYRQMIDHVREVTNDLASVCPQYDADDGFELSGFVWFQGWNDMVNREIYPERRGDENYERFEKYSTWLGHFIRDVRRDLDTPKLPFVIGVMGVGGDQPNEGNAAFRRAMAAPASWDEFRGNVTAVQTSRFWAPELEAIHKKYDQVSQLARNLRNKNKNFANRDGTMSEAEQKERVAQLESELISPEEAALRKRGASNAPYHYMGCAKTFARMGEAFANEILALEKAGATGAEESPDTPDTSSLRGRRPNIVFVLTDDQGKGELSCYGNQVLKTPHLDQLFAESVRLDDYHVSPTCSPTRSALMSGRHPFKNGVTHTRHERERMSLASVTIAEVLRNAGYTTGIFGKWHLGDQDAYQPDRRGFDEVFIHGAGGVGQAYPDSCGDVPPNAGPNRYFDIVMKHNGTFEKTEGYCCDVYFEQALGWIRDCKDKDKPFFAYIASNTPHGPLIAPEECKQPFLDHGWDKNTANKFGMIVNIDQNVGRLRAKLKEWELDADTLLIFMTDNGAAPLGRATRDGQRFVHHNAGMKGHKGSTDEGGTRVPAFFHWKGVLPEGVDVEALTRHIDIFPTFADLAGATYPHGQVDGRSLLPLLIDRNAEWADRMLFIRKGRWASMSNPEDARRSGFAVRNERFRLADDGKTLFDIDADPGQTTDVAAQHPEVVSKLVAAHEEFWAQARPLMVNEYVPYSKVTPFVRDYEAQLAAQGIPRWKRPELD